MLSSKLMIIGALAVALIALMLFFGRRGARSSRLGRPPRSTGQADGSVLITAAMLASDGSHPQEHGAHHASPHHGADAGGADGGGG